jgi:hypothetical protein
VDNRNVQQAVFVVIDECGAGGPTAGSDTGAGGYICEHAISDVVVQDVVAVIGDLEIDVPVVVVVPGRHAHAFIGVACTGRFRARSERCVDARTTRSWPQRSLAKYAS